MGAWVFTHPRRAGALHLLRLHNTIKASATKRAGEDLVYHSCEDHPRFWECLIAPLPFPDAVGAERAGEVVTLGTLDVRVVPEARRCLGGLTAWDLARD